jgi:hypothetical protein
MCLKGGLTNSPRSANDEKRFCQGSAEVVGRAMSNRATGIELGAAWKTFFSPRAPVRITPGQLGFS